MLNRFIHKVVIATFALSVFFPMNLADACSGGNCSSKTVTRCGQNGYRSRTKVKCRGGYCQPVCVASCGPSCGQAQSMPQGQPGMGMGMGMGMGAGAGSSFLDSFLAFLMSPGNNRLSASFSYRKKGQSMAETLLLIMLIKKMMEKDEPVTTTMPSYPPSTHGGTPQGRPTAPVPYPSTHVRPNTSRAAEDALMSGVGRSPDSLQEIAQQRANAMARNQHMPSNHAISGAPPIPGVFEGIGTGPNGSNVPTCVGPGAVIADAAALGSNNQVYRVRFYQ